MDCCTRAAGIFQIYGTTQIWRFNVSTYTVHAKNAQLKHLNVCWSLTLTHYFNDYN